MTKATVPQFKFLRNKYSRWHNTIIKRAKKRKLVDYKEQHHILPRCLEGGDNKSNLVDLTFKEHFLIHWLLTKMTEGKARRKMLMALYRMTHIGRTKKIVAGWQYAIARKAVRDSKLGSKKPGVHTESFKRKLRKRMKGNSFNKGKKYGPRSEESRAKMRAAFTEERRAALVLRNKTVISKMLKGRKRPDVARRNQEFHTGRKRSSETRAKMSISALNRWR